MFQVLWVTCLVGGMHEFACSDDWKEWVYVLLFWNLHLGRIESHVFFHIFFVSDGLVARKMNQTSTFGGLLDMVTDRCSTLG